jgi:hypothetical protein
MNFTIDKRKALFLVLDTETAGGFNFPLIYNIGWKIIDKKGNTYLKEEYLINEIFFNEKLMNFAYYKEKLPFYYNELKKGKILAVNAAFVWERLEDIKKTFPKIKICAYNAGFDKFALECTFNKPFESENFIDIWNMFFTFTEKSKKYQDFCEKNGYVYFDRWKNKKFRTNAEVAYRYIKNNLSFIEAHTALNDVEIEAEILTYIIRQKKKTKKEIKILKKFEKKLDFFIQV